MQEEIKSAVRKERALYPEIGLEKLVAKLHAAAPHLRAGRKEVRHAGEALKREAEAAAAAAEAAEAEAAAKAKAKAKAEAEEEAERGPDWTAQVVAHLEAALAQQVQDTLTLTLPLP